MSSQRKPRQSTLTKLPRQTTTSTSRKSRQNSSKTIIPMTALLLSSVKHFDNSYFYAGHEFLQCYLIGKIIDVQSEEFRFKMSFSDATNIIPIYVSKFHKSMQQLISKSLNDKTYWRIFVTAKMREQNDGIDFYCFKMDEITNHNQISDHIGQVIVYNKNISDTV